MNGPYSLDADSVCSEVTRTSPGAYILSENGLRDQQRFGHYVGRSDTDVGGRLQQWIGADSYKVFWYEYASSARTAFLLECQWWHKYQPKNNKRHPEVPAGQNWSCPAAACPYAR